MENKTIETQKTETDAIMNKTHVLVNRGWIYSNTYY